MLVLHGPAASCRAVRMSILGSVQMKEMVAELKQRYDFIFFRFTAHFGVAMPRFWPVEVGGSSFE